MVYKKSMVGFALALAAVFLSHVAQAENSKDVGDYTIHYNAFNSDILSPQIARQYHIQRSKNRGILNVTVLKKVMGTSSQPVSARVRTTATNLTGQLKMLPMRQIRERNAIYYIAQFRVADEETLNFRIEVQPLGQPQSYVVEFQNKFYTR